MYMGKAVGLFFALSLVLGTGCSDNTNQSTETHVQKAQQFFQSGQLPEALIEVKNAVRNSPKDPEIRWLAGQIHLESGNNSAAAKELSKALELGLQRADADLPLVRAWMAQGELQKALDYFESKELTTLSDDARVIFTDLLLQSGDIQQAESILLKLRESAPGLMAVRLGLARIALVRGQQAEAKTLIDEILTIEPNNPFANLISGELAIANSEFDIAQEFYDLAANSSQTRLQAALGSARILLAKSEYQQAKNDLNSILSKQPNIPLALFLRGLADYHLKEFEAAQTTLERVQTALPKHNPTLLLLGKIYLDNNRLEQANSVLTKLLRIDPANSGAKQLLAATKLRLKQPEEALKLIDTDNLDQASNPLVLIVAGSAFIATGNLSEGTALLEKASTLVEDPTLIRSQLGRIYLASGNIESAIEEFRSLTESNEDNPQNLLMLAYAQVQQGDYDQASLTAEKLHQQGAELLAVNLRGALELGRNQTEKAQQHFEAALALDDSFLPARLNLARIAISQKRSDDARDLFEKILTIEPGHTEAILGLAEVVHRLEGSQPAIDILKKYVEQYKNPKALILLANLLSTANSPEKAMRYALQAQDLAPSDARVVIALALVQRKQNKADLGLTTLLTIPESRRDAPFNLLLSQFARTNSQPALARSALENARQQAPDSLKVIINSISLELAENNINQAEKMLRLITPKNDTSGAIRLTLQGDIFRASQQPQQAIDAYTAAFKIEPSANLLHSLSAELLSNGQTKQGIKLLSNWLEQHPKDTRTLLRLANQYMVSGNRSEAGEYYERVLTINPLQPLALNNLAWMYFESGNQRAIALAGSLAELKIQQADILDTVGWIYTNMGDLNEGIEMLKQANDIDPSSADVLFHLAVAYSRNHQDRRAKDLLFTLSSEHPDYAQKQEVISLAAKLGSNVTD